MVTTTHIKTGWLQRNGAPTSDLRDDDGAFIRHGDHLMVVSVVNDPVFLSEPFMRTPDFVLSLTRTPNAWGPAARADRRRDARTRERATSRTTCRA